MAFAKTTAEVLKKADHGTQMKYTIAGETLAFVEKLSIEKVIERPAPAIGPHNAKPVAVALAAIAAKNLLDSEGARAFMVLAKADVSWQMVKNIEVSLINWMVVTD